MNEELQKNLDRILDSPGYRLAYKDEDFLTQPDLRPTPGPGKGGCSMCYRFAGRKCTRHPPASPDESRDEPRQGARVYELLLSWMSRANFSIQP